MSETGSQNARTILDSFRDTKAAAWLAGAGSTMALVIPITEQSSSPGAAAPRGPAANSETLLGPAYLASVDERVNELVGGAYNARRIAINDEVRSEIVQRRSARWLPTPDRPANSWEPFAGFKELQDYAAQAVDAEWQLGQFFESRFPGELRGIDGSVESLSGLRFYEFQNWYREVFPGDEIDLLGKLPPYPEFFSTLSQEEVAEMINLQHTEIRAQELLDQAVSKHFGPSNSEIAALPEEQVRDILLTRARMAFVDAQKWLESEGQKLPCPGPVGIRVLDDIPGEAVAQARLASIEGKLVGCDIDVEAGVLDSEAGAGHVMAHEIAHLAGKGHVADPDHLMHGDVHQTPADMFQEPDPDWTDEEVRRALRKIDKREND